MSTKPPKSGEDAKAAERADRLAAALRANLARRKAQARGRADAVAAPSPESGQNNTRQDS